MVLKGLSRYDVTDEGGEVRVWSRRSGRDMRPSKERFMLYTDDNEQLGFGEGKLRFLMAHPDVDARAVARLPLTMYISKAGEVRSRRGDTHERKYTRFKDAADVFETVDIMKQAAEGNLTPAYAFIMTHRESAARRVSRLMNCCMGRIEAYLPEAEERLLDMIINASFMTVRPMFAMFCMALKTTFMEREFKKVRSDTGSRVKGMIY